MPASPQARFASAEGGAGVDCAGQAGVRLSLPLFSLLSSLFFLKKPGPVRSSFCLLEKLSENALICPFIPDLCPNPSYILHTHRSVQCLCQRFSAPRPAWGRRLLGGREERHPRLPRAVQTLRNRWIQSSLQTEEKLPCMFVYDTEDRLLSANAILKTSWPDSCRARHPSNYTIYRSRQPSSACA